VNKHFVHSRYAWAEQTGRTLAREHLSALHPMHGPAATGISGAHIYPGKADQTLDFFLCCFFSLFWPYAVHRSTGVTGYSGRCASTRKCRMYGNKTYMSTMYMLVTQNSSATVWAKGRIPARAKCFEEGIYSGRSCERLEPRRHAGQWPCIQCAPISKH
jgi:hypothetical protein